MSHCPNLGSLCREEASETWGGKCKGVVPAPLGTQRGNQDLWNRRSSSRTLAQPCCLQCTSYRAASLWQTAPVSVMTSLSLSSRCTLPCKGQGRFREGHSQKDLLGRGGCLAMVTEVIRISPLLGSGKARPALLGLLPWSRTGAMDTECPVLGHEH